MSIESHSPDQEAIPLTEKDSQILSLSDADYHPHTWENLKKLIGDNDLHLLTRYPSQLRKYRQWSADTKQQWGSVTNFVLKNRLHWEPAPPADCYPGSLFKVANPTPLVDEHDYKILVNDWPYGLDEGITHTIVWLKHRLPATPEKGELTPEGRVLLESFVNSTFRLRFGADNVLWFRNWTGIQSVKSLEHVHVLIRNASGAVNDVLKPDT